MLKSDIMNMINDFESETWKYDSTDELDSDMQYIYSIESELKNIDDSYIEQIYNKLIAMIGIIRFKYGFESSIINTMPELERLEKYINEIQLNSNDIINQYNYILNYYTNIINRNHDLGFIKNKYINVEENLNDENSIFYHYQKLINLRKNNKVIQYGKYILLDENNPSIYAYKRVLDNKCILVICNFYEKPVTFEFNGIEKFNVVLSSYKDTNIEIGKICLRSYEAVILEN